MINLAKPAMVLGLVSAVALAMATPSEARNGRNAAAIGAGVAGFAVGAAIGSAAASSHRGYYGDRGYGSHGYYQEPYAAYGYQEPYASGYYQEPYAYAPRGNYYGGDPTGYYAPTYQAPRYRYRNNAREDHLTGTGAGFAN